MEEIEVTVIALVEDGRSQSPIVVLHDRRSNRILPVWIGENEARAIAIALNHISTPRPLTHNLALNLVKQIGAELAKIVVDKLHVNTYYSSIYLKRADEILKIDSRPSDAIALALTAGAPLFVSEDVMRKGGQMNPFPAELLYKQEGPRKLAFTKEELKKISEMLVKAREREEAS